MSEANSHHTFFPRSETSSKIDEYSNSHIDLDSEFKLFWDINIGILSTVLGLMIPYSLSFFYDYNRNCWIMISVIFCLDIFLNFNTSYYFEGIHITKRKYIVLHYIKNYFFLDLLSSFPFEFFYWDMLDFHEESIRSFHNKKELIRFLLLLKLLKLYKIPEILYQIQTHFPYPSIYTIVNIFGYVLIAVLPAHWMCCIFNALYSYSVENDYAYANIIIEVNKDRYLKFFEKVIETMTSVGYGGLSSLTVNDKVFNIFIMCCTSGFLGIFVGAFILALDKSMENTIYFREVLQKFSIYNKNYNVPIQTKLKISYYIRNLKESYNNNLLKEEDIIKMLSIPLRDQIFLITRGYLLIRIPQLKDLSIGFLKSIGYKMTLNFYAPEDIIITEGELTSEIYFIFSGTVNIHHDKTDTMFMKLTKQMHFGEIAFFQQTERTASAMSKNFSEIFSLNRSAFDEILKSMPIDYEKIQILQRNLSSYGLMALGTKCYLCKNAGHVAKNCVSSTFVLDMNKIMQKAQQNRENDALNNSFIRPEIRENILKHYNKNNTFGRVFNAKDSYKERNYLSKKATQYSNSVYAVNRENNKFFTLINEFSNKNSIGDLSNDSSESEKNFIDFSIALLDKSKSVENFENLPFLFCA